MNQIDSSNDGENEARKQKQTRIAVIIIIWSGWAFLALATLSVGGISTLSGEEAVWMIVYWPVAVSYLILVAVPTPLLLAASLIIKQGWISLIAFTVAIVYQILTWPEPVECFGIAPDRCEDAFLTFRWVVWAGWVISVLTFVVQMVGRVTNHVNSDPYIVALRQRREQDNQSD